MIAQGHTAYKTWKLKLSHSTVGGAGGTKNEDRVDGRFRESHRAEADLPRSQIRADQLDQLSMAGAFPVETALADGRPALLLDIGSVGNLAGDQWAQAQEVEATKAGRHPEEKA